MVRRILKIINTKGLHARASAKFVETVSEFDANVQVTKDGLTAGGDSLMGLLMLAAGLHSTIEIETSGPQAGALAQALEALIARKFDEDM